MRRARARVVQAAMLLAWVTLFGSVAACLVPPRPEASPLHTVRGNERGSSSRPDQDEPRARTDGRLPTLAVPERYELELVIDPRERMFSGSTRIALRVNEPTRYVVLHARGLDLGSVTVEIGRSTLRGTPRQRRSPSNATDEVVIVFPTPLPVGPATLRIDYDGPFERESRARGLFRVKEPAGWFAFTQFEAVSARQMFPGFDEPGFKVPFDVTVTVPAGMSAFSNMPEVARIPTGEGIRFRFATTPALPTYLVAIAVGDFEVIDGATAPVPIRLIRPRGNAGDARSALAIADRVTRILAEELGHPYPFAKLDLVAVPPPFHGGMENAGLITFARGSLLPDERNTPFWSYSWRFHLIAHELAHQWAGDLVTPRWWNDVWLNEGFATFLQAYALERWLPARHPRLSVLGAIQNAMRNDETEVAPVVREGVVNVADAERVLRGWAEYEKGAAFLFMLERYLGPDVFRAGLRRYFRDNAWKSVETRDFVRAMEEASGQKLATFAQSFLDQSGVPLIDVDPKCAGGEVSSLAVRQEPAFEPWRPARHRSRTWSIPFCAAVEGTDGTRCWDLGPATAALSFEAPAVRCPRWLDPNPGLAGYYEYAVTEESLERVRPVVGSLATEAAVGLLENAWASVRRRKLDPGALLRFLKAFDAETRVEVLRGVVEILEGMSVFSGEEMDRPFRAFVAARAVRHKAGRGLSRWLDRTRVPSRRPHDDSSALEVERTVLAALRLSGDEATMARAEQRALEWLEHPAQPLDPDFGDIILSLAAQRGAGPVFQGLVAEVEHPSADGNRERALGALGFARDPGLLRRVLDLTLGPSVEPWQAGAVFVNAAKRPATRKLLFDWIVSERTRVGAKWAGDQAWIVGQVIAYACEEKDRDRLERIFAESMSKSSLTENVQQARHCGALTSRLAEVPELAHSREAKKP